MSSFNFMLSVSRKPIFKISSTRQRRNIRNEVGSNSVVPSLASPSSSCIEEINAPVNLADVPSSSTDYADGIDAIHGVDVNDNSSSSSSSLSSSVLCSSEAVPETSFLKSLASYCVDNNINHVQGNNLLTLLRTHSCFSHLPEDIRTVLDTPRTCVATYVVEPGEYVHFDVEAEIVKYIRNASFSPDRELELDFSTDGCALDRAGTIHLWPIQCMIRNIPDARPIVVGIYRGLQKPSDPNRLFNMFIMNITHMLSNGGVDLNGTKLPIKLRCFIADAPARAFILNHRGHTSSRPCSKCKVSGTHSEGRYLFNGIKHLLRTDNQYSQCVDEDHHKEGCSPLSLLPIGMVSQVPFEYMHLVCLGVTKKILSAWISGKFSRLSKLSGSHLARMSARLDKLREFCPSEFGRRPRSLVYYAKYKATEFRQFLLYTVSVVVYGLLNDNLYTHFLFLHTGIQILASQSPSSHFLNFAELALQKFVLRSEELYGPNFCSYNVHGLLHLTNDVRRLGPLDSFSAFPFESNMRIFRKYCRKPGLPLQQFVNRMAEIQAHGANRVRVVPSSDIEVSVPLGCGTDFLQYRRIQFNGMSFSLDVRDNCCILRDCAICILSSIGEHSNTFRLGVQKFTEVDDIFDIGIKSSAVGLYKCRYLSPEFNISPYGVCSKCFRMPFPGDNMDDNEEDEQERREYAVAVMLHSDNM
ncbi:uncharacterized protein LOC123988065 [Osmia bicornis bicornis]|uniref:uncharacterized protein LOC123988065 n=1 Tax=Osmia bicornis bicornis TaxID=1437191 RepID=UPI001EAF8172|nr:uncharacterized protein LOC123988065 [Osmia bicornis bicornis]